MQLPQAFIDKYTNLLGDEAPAFFASLDQDVEHGFRLNPLKAKYQDVALDLHHPVPFVQDAYYGTVSGKSLAHQAGYVYSQDISAMYVAEVAAAQPGERVLDLCAAPGGKSTQLAAQLQNQGLLVSNEINTKRARILAENMERIGATNVIVLNEDPANMEQYFPAYFDKIVVDAPCSGEGMFRKDHNAVTYWHEHYPAECAVRQKNILNSALKMLRPGGQLVYSTCTFAPEEDEQIASWLLATCHELEMVSVPKVAGMTPGQPAFADNDSEMTKAVRMMPHHFQGEGQFVAKFQLAQTAPELAPAPTTKKKKHRGKQARGKSNSLSKEQLALWEEFKQSFFMDRGGQKFSTNNLRLNGNYLYYYDASWPDIDQMKYVRPGILLGEFKKHRFEPSYALALAVQPAKIQAKLDLDESEWRQYVGGNTVQYTGPSQPNGWYLLVCAGKPFAMGKLVNGVIKNFFPKGLRF